MGLDDSSAVIPNIDPLPSKCFTSLIWGDVTRDVIDVCVEFTSNWVTSVSFFITEYARNGCNIMAYCSSTVEARHTMKGKVQQILREDSIDGDTVVITGLDGIMMKSWLVDLFGGKIRSDVCDVAVVVGTSAVNCGISSAHLYYIFCKGFPRTFIEFTQLLG